MQHAGTKEHRDAGYSRHSDEHRVGRWETEPMQVVQQTLGPEISLW